MYYSENNNSGLQSYYFSMSDRELLGSLSNEQQKLVKKYIKEITKYRANSLSNMGLYTFEGSLYDIETGEITYSLNNMIDGSMVVSGDKLKETLGAIGEIIKSYAHEALLEIKYCCYINNTGAYDEYVNDQYNMISYVFKTLVINNTLDDLCNDFIENKLILPKYLKEYFNNSLKEQYRRTVYESAICNVLNKKELSESDRLGYYNEKCLFIKQMREHIMSIFDNTKRLELASRLISFTELYMGLTGNEKRDLMKMADASKQDVYWVQAKNGDRLATKNEVKRLVEGIYKKEVYFLPKDKRELLLYFVWACTGEFKLIRSFTSWDSNTLIIGDIAWIKLDEAIKYLRSSQFLKVDIIELQKGTIETKYLDKADDEIVDNSLGNKLQIVYNRYKDKTDSYSKMVSDIAKKALKYNAVLTAKQVNVVLKAYEQVISASDEEYNKFNAELHRKMVELIEFYAYKKTDFEYKFMQEIIKNKRCSLKQRDLILQWYDGYLEKKNSMFEVDEIGDEYDDVTDNGEATEVREVAENKELKDINDFEIPDLDIDLFDDSESQEKKKSVSLDVELPDLTDGFIWKE